MEEDIIGYGDSECTETCPIRRRNLTECMLMVISTRAQIAAAEQGDMVLATEHERKQNLLAVKLGCRPGRARI